jgi:hypothetical protein
MPPPSKRWDLKLTKPCATGPLAERSAQPVVVPRSRARMTRCGVDSVFIRDVLQGFVQGFLCDLEERWHQGRVRAGAAPSCLSLPICSIGCGYQDWQKVVNR